VPASRTGDGHRRIDPSQFDAFHRLGDEAVAARDFKAESKRTDPGDRMSIELKPLHPVFAAEASGLDLTKPLSDADVRGVNAAMNQYAVLIFRGQPLTAQQQIQFTESFGPLTQGSNASSNARKGLRTSA
jgi:hypothetical protein